MPRLMTYLRRIDPMIWVMMLYVIATAITLACDAIPYHFDTESFKFAAEILNTGRVDIVRTPLYPVIAGIGFLICGNSWAIVAILVQMLVYLISIYALRSVCRRIIPSATLAWLPVIAYVVYPPIVQYNLTASSESLSLSMGVFWLWLMLRTLDRPTLARSAVLGAFMFAMIMERPSFINIFGIIGCMAAGGMLWRRYRHKALILAASLIIPAVGCLGYGLLVKQRVGYFTLTVVSTVNQWTSVRIPKMTYPDLLTDNPEMLAVLRSFEKYRADNYFDCSMTLEEKLIIEERWGHLAMHRYVTGVMRHHTADWLRLQLTKFGYSFTWDVFRINALYYAATLAMCIVIAVRLWRRRRPQSIPILLALTAVINIVTVIFGAEWAWDRLLVSTLPVFFIIITLLIHYVLTSVRRRHDRYAK